MISVHPKVKNFIAWLSIQEALRHPTQHLSSRAVEAFVITEIFVMMIRMDSTSQWTLTADVNSLAHSTLGQISGFGEPERFV